MTNTKCFGGLCDSNTKLCRGKEFGDPCNPEGVVQCDRGFYCSKRTKTCQRQLDVGDKCEDFLPEVPDNEIKEGTNFMVICRGGSKCVGVKGNKFCKKFYNLNLRYVV